MTSIHSLMLNHQREMKNIGEMIGLPYAAKVINENEIYAIDGVTKHDLSPMLRDRFIFATDGMIFIFLKICSLWMR